MWLIVFSLVPLLASALCTAYRFESYTLPLWGAGITLALLGGLWDWWKVRAIRWFDVGCVLVLYALALFLRVGFDLRGLPGFVDNDELFLLGESVKLADGRYKLLDIFWVGIPVFGLFPQALIFQFMEPSILSSRIGEAIFAALAVIAVFDLGRTLANRRVGIAAAVLVAVSHEAIHWARVGMPFILVSTFAAIMMAFAARAVKGGSYLSWVGAAIGMGFGMISYQAGYFLPVLLCLSSIPFFIGRTKVADRWRAFRCYVFILVCGGLIAASPFIKIFGSVSWGSSRPATLLISAEKIPNLANTYGIPRTPVSDVWLHHLTQTFGVLWTGVDGWAQYGARYPLVDPIIGAVLVLLPFMLLFGNRVVGWMSLTWMLAYVVLGVVIIATPPTYHRVSTVVIFAALAAATLVDSLSPRMLKSVALTALCVGSAYCNLEYYFIKYPQRRLPELSSVIARVICPYKNTHDIIDASHAGFVTPEQQKKGAIVFHESLLVADCRGAQVHQVLHKEEIWNLPGAQRSKVLVVATSSTIKELGIHPPAGYSVQTTWEDSSIGAPGPVSLTMVELIKNPG